MEKDIPYSDASQEGPSPQTPSQCGPEVLLRGLGLPREVLAPREHGQALTEAEREKVRAYVAGTLQGTELLEVVQNISRKQSWRDALAEIIGLRKPEAERRRGLEPEEGVSGG